MFVYEIHVIGVVRPTVNRGGLSIVTTGYVKPVPQPSLQPASSYNVSSYGTSTKPQTVVSQPSMTAPYVTTTTTGVAHLWIGWRIEPEEEDFVKRFIEAFKHGKHVYNPIGLPPMGGLLAPTPGAPVVTLSTNQQGLAIQLP